jgi:putative transposase
MPRIFLPNVPCHVTMRGNDRQAIVRSDADRMRLLGCLGQESRRCGMAIHAYVVMTNHIHLLATGNSEFAIARTIQGLGRLYVPYFNQQYGRTGTLWEGRYASSPVASDRYVLTCHRYIESNPVRAGMVSKPLAHFWSSHRYYAAGDADSLVSPHALWFQLGDTESERRQAFLDSFGQLSDEDLKMIRASTSRGLAIGDEASCKALEARLGRRVTGRGKDWRKGCGERHADDRTGDLLASDAEMPAGV